MNYRIGTRGSKLALAQAEYVRDRLAEAYREDTFEIRVIKTKGDRVLDKPLHEIGDKGLFVREIEEQLLDGEVDLGVHSMKDMPSYPADGLKFTKAWKREDARDVLILRRAKTLEELPFGAVIGTGSRRREFQLKKLRPDINVINIRGNVDTRLRKMEEEKLDGIVLAAAGLHRLGMQEKITCYLETEQMIPAPAQGILALEIRQGEETLLAMLDSLSDGEAEAAAKAERGFLQLIGGDCHVPVGAVLKTTKTGSYRLSAMFGNETGTKQAYAQAEGSDPAALAKEAAVHIRWQMAGQVTLVGGGPGDPELITVKGLHAIQEADCIVYDRLSSPELLKEAKADCELIYVGKASSNHTMKQEEINRLLVRKSMEYDKTVRLKGGDSYVFGRGGEEALFLEESGVTFEVVPGVTSAVAGLAYAGIPITHRGMASGFHVVTAHDKNDRLADIDFAAMAKGKETCVFLMGLSKVGEIADRLMEAGMAETVSAAVISQAATPAQKSCISDLLHIAEEVKRANLVSPAIIAVGDVVSLRDQLDFFEKRPLFGLRYLIPKIGEASTRLCKLLKKQGAAVDEIQVGMIVNKKNCFLADELKDVDWMIFTSKHGVAAFFENFYESGLDMRNLAGCKIAAIGKKTAEVLNQYGIRADLIPPEFHSDALAETLGSCLTGKEQVWYLKAENADGHLGAALEGICEFKEIAVYENRGVEPELDKLQPLDAYDGVIFTCASSAERMIQVFKEGWEKKTRIYSIGPKTTACLNAHGIKHVTESKRADYEGIVETIVTV